MIRRRSAPAAEATQVIREILRRSGHEIRNALNAVAVNVEVVRSRAGREGTGEVTSFAERAGSQIAEASALTDGLLALLGLVVRAQAESGVKVSTDHAHGSRIELTSYTEAGGSVSDIGRLASRIDVGVEEHAGTVILSVYPEGTSHSKI
ncbi:MAG: hypothetical protein ABR585_06380 [Gemmatimonadaceae bacterium]